MILARWLILALKSGGFDEYDSALYVVAIEKNNRVIVCDHVGTNFKSMKVSRLIIKNSNILFSVIVR